MFKRLKSTFATVFTCLALSMPHLAIAAPLGDAGESAWSQILIQYGRAGDLNRFDYAALSATPQDMDRLDHYIDELAMQSASSLPRDEAIVYWGNLYNALTVQVVAQNWPVDSIKEIKSGAFSAGPWKRKLVSVEGETLSLNNIEHDILRKEYTDARIHYVVNCASIGCPNLRLEEWSAQGLEDDLDAAARSYVNSNRGARVEDGKLIVSSIYKWFKEDFGGNETGVIAHLKKYADAELADQLATITKVSSYEYDWSVNAQ